MALCLAVLAAAFLYFKGTADLVLQDARTDEIIQKYRLRAGDGFCITFIHSVNKSPVTDFYEIRRDGIYVVKTVYYGFGAGVQTELQEGQTLTYGEDGSMIVSGFNMKMNDLIYNVGTVSDHVLTLCRNADPDGFFAPDTVPDLSYETLNEYLAEFAGSESLNILKGTGDRSRKERYEKISLRSLCGRSAKVRFRTEWIL